MYSKCLSIDDFKKKGYYISHSFNKIFKKRKRKDDLRKSIKGTKMQTIICKLFIHLTSKVSISIPFKDFDMRKVLNQFYKLYYEIDNTKKSEDQANRDIVYFYFRFEKVLLK